MSRDIDVFERSYDLFLPEKYVGGIRAIQVMQHIFFNLTVSQARIDEFNSLMRDLKVGEDEVFMHYSRQCRVVRVK